MAEFILTYMHRDELRLALFGVILNDVRKVYTSRATLALTFQRRLRNIPFRGNERTHFVYVVGASFGSWIKERGIINWFEESFPYFTFVNVSRHVCRNLFGGTCTAMN